MAIKSLQHSSITDNIFYSSMLAGNAAFDPGDEDILAEQVLSSSAASVTFSGLDTLAAGYQHLQIRALTRNDGSGTTSSTTRLLLRFNGDTAGNYSTHSLFARGSSVVSTAATNNADIWVSTDDISTGATANAFQASVLDILDPFETTKYTTVRALAGFAASHNYIGLNSGSWRNTTAITSITYLPASASNFLTGSTFTLIGVK